MLIQFNFKNFKGFKDETTLDMTATSITEHSYNLIDVSDDEKYVKIAAIYGANASGKSSVIQAFMFMSKWIRDSFKEASTNASIPLKRFAFDDESKNSPAEFEVFFKCNNEEYQYGFSLDNTKIHEEWLYMKKSDSSDKYIPLFERAEFDVHPNPKMLKGASNFIPMLKEKTLFLSIISGAKLPYIDDVLRWFLSPCLDFGDILYENTFIKLHPNAIENPKYQKELVMFLNSIDINIEGIIVDKVLDASTNNYDYKIYTKHLMTDGDNYYNLPLSEESSGTQKMFSLFFYIKYSLVLGIPLFIDELDSKLHPLLLRYILSMFHDEDINKNGAQLIYATHDNYTLTKDIFRRDQIWFVEKDANAVSNLYSLVEYKLDDDKKVRKDASYNKDYLLGKYGAVPILRGYDMWRDESNGIK